MLEIIFFVIGESFNRISIHCYGWCKEVHCLLAHKDVLLREVSTWWNLCVHAIAAIAYRKKYAEDYCSMYYNNKTFQDAYAILIDLLPCERTWVIPDEVLDEVVLPPNIKRGPGRPWNYDLKIFFMEVKFKRTKIIYSKCGSADQN